MAHCTFTIELKVDLDEKDERIEPMSRLVAIAARDLIVQAAVLIPSEKAPKAAVFREDSMFNATDIEIDFDEDRPDGVEIASVAGDGSDGSDGSDEGNG